MSTAAASGFGADAARAVAAAAAAALRASSSGSGSGGGGGGSSGGGSGGAASMSGNFSHAVAQSGFKCSYPSCGEGVSWINQNERGPCFEAGTMRKAFWNENRKDWDGFCPTHAHTAEEHRQRAIRYYDTHKNRTPSHIPEPDLPRPVRPRQSEGAIGSTAARGKGRKRKADDAIAAGAGAGAGRNVTPESIAAQKALLAMSFPRELPLSENDADLSQKLERRQQRHEVMDVEKVHALVSKVVTRRVKGIPIPQNNGSLSRAGEAWKAVNEDMLPVLHLGCPINRAERLVHNATARGGGGLSDAVKQEILAGFQCTGTIVVFSPEVRKCDSKNSV